ncbi:acyltransferase family protein [Neisseria wadsworthii]|uniref:acyltransferase family protein n=2 Tax=Neisseria TaxID=482 RepID=UPI000D31E863|nr:acyltransferase [Neisseria wadsworthii]
MKYRSEIDGLRAIAVVSVILFHAGLPFLSGGYVGVDIFFVISGYLISTIIFDEVEQKKFSFITFYERRARRIVPALSLIMLCSIVPAYLLLQPSDLISFGNSLIAIPIFLSNVLFWSERGYFGAAAELKPLIHTWSLAVEEQFYLLYPIFVIAIFKWFRKYLAAILIACLILSLAASYYVTRLHFETGFFLPFTRAWEMLFGGMAALLIRNRIIEKYPFNGTVASFIGLAMMCYAIFAFDDKTLFPGIAAAIPVIGTFLVLISPQQNNLVHKFLANKVFVFLGLTSYSLYLWHQPIFAYISYMQLGHGWLYASIIPVVILSAISYKWVETPFRNKQLMTRKTVFSFALITSVFFIVAGGIIVLNKGFVNRYNEADQKILTSVTGASEYNSERFDAVDLAEFEGSGKRKVFLVGDSFAKDFMNLVYESGNDKRFSFSTKQINSECGNIYVPFEKDANIPATRRMRCDSIGWFESDKVKQRMQEADEIWLVSKWQAWVVPYIRPSVEQIEKDFQKPVKVFGIKDFGKSSSIVAMNIPADKRLSYTQPAARDAVDVEQKMQENVPAKNFRSLLSLYCGKDFGSCPMFTGDGSLISQDGGHLTQSGAVYLADKLTPLLENNQGK